MRLAIEGSLAAAGYSLPFAFVVAELFGLSAAVLSGVLAYLALVVMFYRMEPRHEQDQSSAARSHAGCC